MPYTYTKTAVQSPELIIENSLVDRYGVLNPIEGNPSVKRVANADNFMLRAVVAGLDLEAAGGLVLRRTAGIYQAAKSRVLENYSLATLPDDTAALYIWITEVGKIVYSTAAGDIPQEGFLFLGIATTSDGAITAIDRSGVTFVSGGLVYRRTADAAAPTDTPPSYVRMLVKTAGGIYFWDGAAYNALTQTPVAAVFGPTAGWTMLAKKIQLNGVNPTPVAFQDDTAASILSSNSEPYNIANGATFIVNPDGDGDDTQTWTATAGTSTGGTDPSTNMTAEVDTKMNIAVDGGEPTEVTFDWTTGNSGANIATQMQTAIRALGGAFANVSVAFDTDHYVVTSGTLGTGSSVVITPSASGSCTEELKLGVAGGGTEEAGTGDAANSGAATAEEVAAFLVGSAKIDAVAEDGKVRVSSKTTGKDSSLVVNAASTMDTVLGITGSAYGAQGIGASVDAANDDYFVQATRNGDAAVADADLAVGARTTTGFNVYCEKADDAGYVDLQVMVQLAA